ncbi:undecaprenyl-diphosphate phosphatase [Thermophagus sp. OGC60D27]|uniref:undecaprenyl-diphosphate phosphatase n=1 Tax=Thermophagus sp. OGC60D27 TaxID=3458415 RepID=UPI004037D12A
MLWFEALLLGLIQGLTEFLPVSSSGHLEIGRHLLGVETTDNLRFTVVVHGATVLSTLVVFRKDIIHLLGGFFKFQWNEETKYISLIILSMLPIAVVGLFFKDYVEELFDSEKILLVVGVMLLVTASLLAFSYFRKTGKRDIGYWDALIIGVAQTIAVIPGISRSGSTIATGLLLGNKRSEVARFSFLMVLVPIIGENILSVLKSDLPSTSASSAIAPGILLIGFLAAFISGLMACKWMIEIVKKGKLIYFALYCVIAGSLAIAGYMW